jgi:hypothetical protein
MGTTIVVLIPYLAQAGGVAELPVFTGGRSNVAARES